MNKKFFAALASATMVLSTFGSAAVFADGFDTAKATDTETGSDATASDGSVAFSTENFPDADFRAAIAKVLPNVQLNQSISKADLAKVTELSVASANNVQGIQYFPNLTSFTSTSANLAGADLSANKNLETISITNASTLESLKTPATNTLKKITINGGSTTSPLPELDLSGAKALNSVAISNTEVALLDLSDNSMLTDVEVKDNKLNTLKLDGALNLANVDASHNHLYEITLPANSNLSTLNLSDNKLLTVDVTAQPALTSLNVANNSINKLDVTKNANLTSLNVSNNRLGALDLSKNANLTTEALDNQHAYVDATSNSVDLEDVFEGLNLDNVTNAKNGMITNGDFVFSDQQNAGSYTYQTGKKDMPVALIKADLMNRLYNPNSGEHFYTRDNHEKDVLVSLGWKYEGIGWVAPEENEGTTSPVYRLYNPNAGDHHYTLNAEERDALVKAGWKAEGIGWYSPDGDTTFTAAQTGLSNSMTVARLALFREYNPNAKAAGAHNYTLNEAENDYLVSIGWLPEGTAWYALK